MPFAVEPLNQELSHYLPDALNTSPEGSIEMTKLNSALLWAKLRTGKYKHAVITVKIVIHAGELISIERTIIEKSVSSELSFPRIR